MPDVLRCLRSLRLRDLRRQLIGCGKCTSNLRPAVGFSLPDQPYPGQRWLPIDGRALQAYLAAAPTVALAVRRTCTALLGDQRQGQFRAITGPSHGLPCRRTCAAMSSADCSSSPFRAPLSLDGTPAIVVASARAGWFWARAAKLSTVRYTSKGHLDGRPAVENSSTCPSARQRGLAGSVGP
jgi:hypothetical protein